MALLGKLLTLFQKPDRIQRRAQRKAKIAVLGFDLVDESGWHDGQYSRRRYFLRRKEETVAGPFASSSDALKAAQEIVNPKPK